ncbi:MAG: branched-chain amino acid ABC transporter permease [Desulfurococcales archaeon]|nr:branched-chain amino acid ABC transporter permease [Desulfurococcales archaeon]
MINIDFWIFSDTWLILVISYFIVTISLNLEAGYTGIPNFGKAVFVFMGAWAAQGIGIRLAAFFMQHYDPEDSVKLIERLNAMLGGNYHSLVQAAGSTEANRIVAPYIFQFLFAHPIIDIALFIMIVVITLVLAAIMGLIASYAALRLREEYLAILLLSFSELVVMVIFNQTESLNGGPKGLWAVKFYPDNRLFALVLGGVIALLVYIYSEKIGNSPMGRAMRAVRDDEVAAEVFGRDVAMTRLKVIMVSSMIAALAGLVYIEGNPSAQTVTFSRVIWTFFPWAFLILGGMANNKGAILGVLVFMILKRFVEFYIPQMATGHSAEIQMFAAYSSNIIVGLLIILVLYFRPQGVLPEKPSKTMDFNDILEEAK